MGRRVMQRPFYVSFAMNNQIRVCIILFWGSPIPDCLYNRYLRFRWYALSKVGGMAFDVSRTGYAC